MRSSVRNEPFRSVARDNRLPRSQWHKLFRLHVHQRVEQTLCGFGLGIKSHRWWAGPPTGGRERWWTLQLTNFPLTVFVTEYIVCVFQSLMLAQRFFIDESFWRRGKSLACASSPSCKGLMRETAHSGFYVSLNNACVTRPVLGKRSCRGCSQCATNI